MLWSCGLTELLKLLIGLVAISIALFAALIPLNLFLIKSQMGSLSWLNESVEYALYVGVFIGAPWVLQQGAHVRVDVLLSAISNKAAMKMEILLCLVGAALCALLCYYGIRATWWEYIDGTFPDKDLRIANWYMLAVFSFSFFLLGIEFLFRLRPKRLQASQDADITEKAAL